MKKFRSKKNIYLCYIKKRLLNKNIKWSDKLINDIITNKLILNIIDYVIKKWRTEKLFED